MLLIGFVIHLGREYMCSVDNHWFMVSSNFDQTSTSIKYCHKQQNEKNEKNEGKARGWGKNDEWNEDDYYLVFSIFVS